MLAIRENLPGLLPRSLKNLQTDLHQLKKASSAGTRLEKRPFNPKGILKCPETFSLAQDANRASNSWIIPTLVKLGKNRQTVLKEDREVSPIAKPIPGCKYVLSLVAVKKVLAVGANLVFAQAWRKNLALTGTYENLRSPSAPSK